MMQKTFILFFYGDDIIVPSSSVPSSRRQVVARDDTVCYIDMGKDSVDGEPVGMEVMCTQQGLVQWLRYWWPRLMLGIKVKVYTTDQGMGECGRTAEGHLELSTL
jgi:hypothetical protein